jgi:hypothetical protein
LDVTKEVRMEREIDMIKVTIHVEYVDGDSKGEEMEIQHISFCEPFSLAN